MSSISFSQSYKDTQNESWFIRMVGVSGFEVPSLLWLVKEQVTFVATNWWMCVAKAMPSMPVKLLSIVAAAPTLAKS